MLDPRRSGRKNQAAHETRNDVVVYSSEPLTRPFELIGPVTAQLKGRTSGAWFDLFVRLCDVDERAVSMNVCDGIQRSSADMPPDAEGVRTVDVRLSPTGYRFQPGHRLRVQICGGSFPHFSRHTGTPDPLGSAELVPVDVEILAGSTLTISVMPTG
jgi:putative CocE/NonD family hydrolase